MHEISRGLTVSHMIWTVKTVDYGEGCCIRTQELKWSLWKERGEGMKN